MTSWVLPIKPKFAAMIYSGQKTVELRRWTPNAIVAPQALGDGKEWATVLLYETAPVQRITGCVQLRFRYGRECRNVDDELLAAACLSRSEFDEYTDWPHSLLSYIGILDVKGGCRFAVPQTLADHGLKRAPQTWVRSRKGE